MVTSHRFGSSLMWSLFLCLSLVGTATASSSSGTYHFRRGVAGDASASQQRRDREQVTNNSEDAATTQVDIYPFQLLLSTTPNGISESQEPEIRRTARSVLTQHLSHQILPEGTSFEIVMLLDITDNVFDDGGSGRRQLQASTTLSFNGGIAMYDGDDPPASAQLAEWIATGLEDGLASALQAASPSSFGTIDSVTYISLTESPTPSPVTEVGGVEKGPEGYDNEDDSVPLGILLGSLAGGFLFVALVVGMFLHRRRQQRRSTKPISLSSHHGGEEDDATNVESYEGDNASLNRSLEDGHSVGEDSDAFTLSTAADDHTIRSVASRAGRTNMMSVDNSAKRHSIHKTESFEHDRQVSLHKDVLHTSPGWTTADAYNGATKNNKNSDTVLQPSHFSSDSEFEPDVEWNPDDGSRGGDADSAGSPFLFEGGEGEEVYLMPPKKSSRTERVVPYDLEVISEEHKTDTATGNNADL